MDLETRSMRGDLLFYGIEEGGDGENCETEKKNFCKDVLKDTTADTFMLDRVHRLGQKKSSIPNPIVAKFHYPAERTPDIGV